MLRAAAGALPFVPRGDHLPARTLTVSESGRSTATNVAAYAGVTGLRYGDTVPLTYPFALTFPTVMKLITGFDFPFPAIGSVHVENQITRYRPIAVTDTVGVRTHAENLREHRKGLLVDVVTDVSVGNDVVWHQVTTFLHQQRTSLSDEPKPPPAKQPKLPPPNSILRITPGQIRRYASVGGDHNPIHTSPIGAKLFGFPTAIAHGMFSAAAVLANIEGQIPDAVRYSVQVRQAGDPARQCGTLRRPRRGRLGSVATQHEQGVPASDGRGPGAVAPGVRSLNAAESRSPSPSTASRSLGLPFSPRQNRLINSSTASSTSTSPALTRVATASPAPTSAIAIM